MLSIKWALKFCRLHLWVGRFCHIFTTWSFWAKKIQGSPALESSYPPIARVVVPESAPRRGGPRQLGVGSWNGVFGTPLPSTSESSVVPTSPRRFVSTSPNQVAMVCKWKNPSSILQSASLDYIASIYTGYIGVVWSTLGVPSLEVIECEELTWTASFDIL